MDERPGADVTAVAGRPPELRTAPLLDGRYRLGPVLARGGMSTVHRATDTRLDRPVAVKVMDPRLAADPAFRARFEREARSAARIDHPAVVDVHDQGTCVLGDGGPVVFLVMELVEGGTLRDVLRAAGRAAGRRRRWPCSSRCSTAWRRRTGAGSCTATSSPRTC